MLDCNQDLECDVSVEDDNRQEWVFTLYDFDNSGKVTKEVCVFLTEFTPLHCLLSPEPSSPCLSS